MNFCLIIILARESIFRFGYLSGFLIFVVVVLTIMIYCTFRRISLLSFLYTFFESRLIPTLFLILGWGYQPERVQAAIYLLFYTLLASLPLLVVILFIYNSLGSLCLFLLSGGNFLVGGFPRHKGTQSSGGMAPLILKTSALVNISGLHVAADIIGWVPEPVWTF